MTTVPKPDPSSAVHIPPDNHIDYHLQVSNSRELYARPSAGGNATGNADSPPGSPVGLGSLGVPPGVVPPNPVMGAIKTVQPSGSLSLAYADAGYPEAMAGQSVSTGDTLAGPDMGHGATIVMGDSGDRPSGAPDSATSGGGSVGDSGSQGNLVGDESAVDFAVVVTPPSLSPD